MKRALSNVFVFALIVQFAQAQSHQPPVKTTTAGVLIDVSVVDSKGQPVLDLAPADFELTEDGKRQQLVSVTLMNGGVAKPVGTPNPGPATNAAPTAPSVEQSPAPENTPTVTAILFDKLSPEAMPYAVRDAATTFRTIDEYCGSTGYREFTRTSLNTC